MKENNNKNGHCPNCQVSDDTIQKLKDSAQDGKKAEYESKKQTRENERVAKDRAGKFKKAVFWAVGVAVIIAVVFVAFNYFSAKEAGAVKATVYFSPTCSCCKQYITYLRSKGFDVEAKQTNNMLEIKEKYNIPSNVESCHTTIIGDYFVEGHMPIQFVEKLLAEKPDVDGIALPGMPQGSPGMPGFKSSSIEIHAVNNGNSSEFAKW